MHIFSHNYRNRWNSFNITRRKERNKSAKELEKDILVNLKNVIYEQQQILDSYLTTIEMQNKEIKELENRLIKANIKK